MNRARAARPRRLGPAAAGLAATLAIHVVAIAAFVWARGGAEASPRIDPRNVVEVEVVRFGRPRRADWLPRKEAPTPVAAPADAVRLTSSDQAAPARPTDPRPTDPKAPATTARAELLRQIEDERDREPAPGVEPEGSPDGLRGGTSAEGRGHPYYQALKARVNQLWSVSFVTDEELAALSAVGCVQLGEDGTILARERKSSSGNARFDRSLEEALARLDKLDPVPPELRAEVAQGLCLRFHK